MSREAVRWAVVGTSEFATDWIAPAIVRSERGQLEAIVSRDAERARVMARRFGAPLSATSIGDLPKGSIDVVHLVTPNEVHEPLTEEAAGCGYHIVVEKPMAPSVTAARRMADVAAAANVLLAVGHCMAWAPPMVAAAKALADGRIGNPLYATIAAGFDSPPQTLWRQDRTTEKGGGPLQDLGPHMVDALLRLFGPVVSVTGILGRLAYDYAADDSSTTLLHFRSGVQAVIHASFASSENDLMIQGSAGRLTSREWLGREFAGDLVWTTADHGVGSFGRDKQRARPMAIELTARNVYVPQVEDVSSAIADGTPLAVSAEQGIAVLEVIEAAIQSARTIGSPITDTRRDVPTR